MNNCNLLQVNVEKLETNFGHIVCSKIYMNIYEPYLSTVKKVNHRIALSRLRVSCHSLEIEVGRYKKPTPTPPESRLCRHCHLVEDEIHFLCDCVQFIDLREDLLQTASLYIPSIMLMSSTEKFTTLLHCKIPPVINAVASYTYKAFKLRDSYIQY